MNYIELIEWRYKSRKTAESEYIHELADIEKNYLEEWQKLVKENEGKKYKVWRQYEGHLAHCEWDGVDLFGAILNIKHLIPNSVYYMEIREGKLMVFYTGTIKYIWLEEVQE